MARASCCASSTAARACGISASWGCRRRCCRSFEQLVRQPHGIVLVTGPTGSGKTTTLYGAIGRLNQPGVKIVTVEDPVEYQIAGVTQIPVNPKIGLTFAAALRSILRHDPDVIMVGEMRDREAAEIAIQAALTGHLVFSTLHTNDAPAGVTRMVRHGHRAVPRRGDRAGHRRAATGAGGVRALRRGRRIRRRTCWRAIGVGQSAVESPRFRRGRGCEDCGGHRVSRADRIVRADAHDTGAARGRRAAGAAVGAARTGRRRGYRVAARGGVGEGVRGDHDGWRKCCGRLATRHTSDRASEGQCHGQFRYRAATPDGQFVEGVMQAPSQQSVLDGLRRQQLYPVRVDEAPAAGAAVRGRRLGRRAAVVVWTRNLASLLGAGVPLDRALAFTVSTRGTRAWPRRCGDVRRSVQGGAIAGRCAGAAAAVFRCRCSWSWCRRARSSGALDVVFAQLSQQLEESAELTSQVRSALLYPAIMAVVARDRRRGAVGVRHSAIRVGTGGHGRDAAARARDAARREPCADGVVVALAACCGLGGAVASGKRSRGRACACAGTGRGSAGPSWATSSASTRPRE